MCQTKFFIHINSLFTFYLAKVSKARFSTSKPIADVGVAIIDMQNEYDLDIEEIRAENPMFYRIRHQKLICL